LRFARISFELLVFAPGKPPNIELQLFLSHSQAQYVSKFLKATAPDFHLEFSIRRLGSTSISPGALLSIGSLPPTSSTSINHIDWLEVLLDADGKLLVRITARLGGESTLSVVRATAPVGKYTKVRRAIFVPLKNPIRVRTGPVAKGHLPKRVEQQKVTCF
jgi:hypothetical protein